MYNSMSSCLEKTESFRVEFYSFLNTSVIPCISYYPEAIKIKKAELKELQKMSEDMEDNNGQLTKYKLKQDQAKIVEVSV